MPPSRPVPVLSQSTRSFPTPGGDGGPPAACTNRQVSRRPSPSSAQTIRGDVSSSQNPSYGRIRCNWPGCDKTFTRAPDLDRHHNSVHQLTKQFWCTATGCDRSESFAGPKRPFPRKDKLTSHVKAVHQAAVPPYSQSSNLAEARTLSAAGSSGPKGLAGIEESNIVSGSIKTVVPATINVSSSACGVARASDFNSVEEPVRAIRSASIDSWAGFSQFAYTSAAGVDRFAGNGDMRNVNALTHNGFANINYFSNMDELIVSGWFARTGGPTYFDNYYAANGFTGTNELVNFDGFSNIGRYPSFADPNSMASVSSVDGIISVGELANIDGPLAINRAASAFEGTSGLAGSGMLDYIDGCVTMENSSFVSYPAGINDLTDVNEIHDFDGIVNVNAFTSIEGLDDIGRVTCVDSSVHMEGHNGGVESSNCIAVGDALVEVDDFGFVRGFESM